MNDIDIDKTARDLPSMTLHGYIPTATTMALAARVVELLDRVAELEREKEQIKVLAAKAVRSGERRVANLESAMREISASFSNDCESPTDADILPRHVKAELGKMQEKIEGLEAELDLLRASGVYLSKCQSKQPR